MKLRLAIGACLPLALAACGSDDGPEQKDIQPIPAPVYEFTSGDMDGQGLSNAFPPGVYQFKFTTDAQGADGDNGVALISPTGRTIFTTSSAPPIQGASRIKAEPNDRFKAQLLYSEAEGEASLIIQGQRDQTTDYQTASINGTIEDSETNLLMDTFQMIRDARTSGISAHLSGLEGTYRQVSEKGITTNLRVAADGSLTGNDSTGCEFTGNIITPAAGTNLLEAKYNAEYCGSDGEMTGAERDGQYFALGYTPDDYKLTLFSASETNFQHFTGTDLAAPVIAEETLGFVSDNLNINTQVANVFNPGIYTYSSAVGPAPTNPVFALLSPTGRVAIRTSTGNLYSHFRVTDTMTFTADAIDIQAGFGAEIETMFGAPEQENTPFSIIGSLMDMNGNLSERYRLTRLDAESQGELTNETIARTYAALWSAEITTTINIDPDGTLTGSDTTGCIFAGEAFIPDADLNLIEAQFTASGCTASENSTGAERNGDFNALGTIQEDQLTLYMTNGIYTFNFVENL